MTELLARDGEGATTLVRVTVTGAADGTEARAIAKSLVNSPLVKTMVFGGDPNVGRILMAVGKCFACRVDPGRIGASICGVRVLESGTRLTFDEAAVRGLLRGDPVDLEVDLGVGGGSARAWGCDLTTAMSTRTRPTTRAEGLELRAASPGTVGGFTLLGYDPPWRRSPGARRRADAREVASRAHGPGTQPPTQDRPR